MDAPRAQPDPRALAQDIVDRCLAAGFALAGVCAARPSDRRAEYERWIADGRFGSMAWLAKDIDDRMDPRTLLPGARSIVVVADRYARRADTAPPAPADNRGRIARYAQGDDYHEVVKRRLHHIADRLREEIPGAEFRTCVDTAPLLEREQALRAGLGWVGKHTLIINPALGSWLSLGALVTTLHLEPPAAQTVPTDRCGACTRCIDACPTRAIEPYSVDASRCVSYLTIERHDPIPPDLARSMGDWIFGCDVCQEVCPHNAPRSGAPDGPILPRYEPKRPTLPLDEIAEWGPAERAAALKDSPIKRATLPMLQRNAAIAQENQRRGG